MRTKITVNPKKLTNEIIQQMGLEYIEKYGNEPQRDCCFCFFSHRSHPVAKKFRNYDIKSTTREKWIFVADRYAELPSNYGELASSIRDLFHTVFGWTIFRSNIGMDDFPPAYISKMMKDFLNEYFADKLDREINSKGMTVK